MPDKTIDIIFNNFANRHSVRDFSDKIINRRDIDKIVSAGMMAPFGGATGMTLLETRKIFIIAPKTPERILLESELRRVMKRNARKLRLLSFFNKKYKPFYERTRNFATHGVPALHQNTYWIIIAEKKGFPPITKQSMSHALQNMWLAATAFGYGFQMLSATGMMSKSTRALKILGLEYGAYDIDGCLTGIKKTK